MGALSEAAFRALVMLVTEHKDSCKPGDAESVAYLCFWGTSWLLGFTQPLHRVFLTYPLDQPASEVHGYFSMSEMHANDIRNKIKNNYNNKDQAA